MTCKFCNAWRPKQSNFYNALFKLHFAWQNVLQQCSFFACHCIFFALRTEKIRRPGGGLCHCKISILIFALLRICEKAVQFLHWNCKFYTASKTEFCSVKIAMLCLCVTASWSSVFFYTGIVKRSSAKQNGCSGYVLQVFTFQFPVRSVN